MKIEYEEEPHMSIEQFADKNQLTLQVYKRFVKDGEATLRKFTVFFKNVKILLESGRFSTLCGEGETKNTAINSYIQLISRKKLYDCKNKLAFPVPALEDYKEENEDLS